MFRTRKSTGPRSQVLTRSLPSLGVGEKYFAFASDGVARNESPSYSACSACRIRVAFRSTAWISTGRPKQRNCCSYWTIAIE